MSLYDSDTDDTDDTVTDAQEAPETTQADAEVDDGGDDADDAQEDEEAGSKKPGVRARLKAAEADRDRLTAMVDRAQAMLLDVAIERSGVNEQTRPALLAAMKADNEFDVDDYVDNDGLYDLEMLSAAVESKREELGLPRKPRPMSQAGRGPGDVKPEVPTTFGGVLREHVASRR